MTFQKQYNKILKKKTFIQTFFFGSDETESHENTISVSLSVAFLE